MNLTTLTINNNIYRAYYSDDTSLIISKNDAEELSKAYNIRIENDETNQVTIKGITYNIEQRQTIADMIEKNLNNVARMMAENKCVAQLLLRRPKGKVYFMTNEFDNGHCNVPFSIGA